MASADENLRRFHEGLAHLKRLESCDFYTYFPDTGPHRRELYKRHMEFFESGAEFSQRLFCAANRIGKTKAGAFEVVCHLTGEYPHWWDGKRFTQPGEWWVCGKDWGTVRDIVQTALVGPVTTDGKLQGGGMLPFDKIHHYTRRPHGLPGGLDTIWVKHKAGGYAVAQFKAYEQSRKSFEGTAKQGVWDDEEPPEDVYTEQLYRTATTGGIMLVTFTPLEGMSRVVMGFVQPDDDEAKKYKRLINAGWDDVPHLDPAAKAALLATTPPFQRDARTKGIPQLGSGAVYGFPESELVIPTMAVPPHWVHCAGADAGGGAKPTAAAWLAADPRVGGQVQVYDTYKRESPEVAIHLAAMKAKGDWIPFFMDAAALIVTEHDAEQLVNLYRRGGLNVELPNKAVETGIQQVWELISAGRFKVQAHCVDWLKEFRMYQRDQHGRIVKRDDHLMDATRYGVISGLARAKPRPAPKSARRGTLPGQGGDSSWMQ